MKSGLTVRNDRHGEGLNSCIRQRSPKREQHATTTAEETE